MAEKGALDEKFDLRIDRRTQSTSFMDAFISRLSTSLHFHALYRNFLNRTGMKPLMSGTLRQKLMRFQQHKSVIHRCKSHMHPRTVTKATSEDITVSAKGAIDEGKSIERQSKLLDLVFYRKLEPQNAHQVFR